MTEDAGNNAPAADPQTPGRTSGPAAAFVPARSGALGGARPSAREAAAAEREIKTGFDEEVDARERAERDPRKYREPDSINEAVGATLFRVNYGESGWCVKNGQDFMVTRYYLFHRIAIDMPRNDREARLIPEKRDVMRKLGIVYLGLPYGSSLSLTEFTNAIAAEKKVVLDLMKAAKKKPAAATAPTAPPAADKAEGQAAPSGQGPSAPEAHTGNKGVTRNA